jgi:hypothetical protein
MRCVLFAVLLALPFLAVADQERLPVPLVFVSPSNEYYFKLIPAAGPHFHERDARGELYRVEKGKDTLLYETSGWFSFEVVVSADGNSLARRGPWPMLGIPESQTVAIAFYSRGVLTNRYTVSDLVENLNCLPRTLGHYDWGGKLLWGVDLLWGVRAQGEIAVVDTYDGQSIIFDMKNGRIVEKRRITAGCSGPGTAGR